MNTISLNNNWINIVNATQYLKVTQAYVICAARQTRENAKPMQSD